MVDSAVLEQNINNEKHWSVYLHIVPKEINDYDYDKYYVGMTGEVPIEKRYGLNGSSYHGTYFYRVFKNMDGTIYNIKYWLLILQNQKHVN